VFRVSPGIARDSLFNELYRMGAKNIVLSTNIRLRLDGIPYANQSALEDAGIAVYFNYKDRPMVFACDRWDDVYDNIWATAKTINAIRGIERWGASDMLERAFSGFTALPAPMKTPSWWDILEVDKEATVEEIKAARDRLAGKFHPDKAGGSHQRMAEINYAYERALESKADFF